MIVSAKNVRRVVFAFGVLLGMGLGFLYWYASQLTCGESPDNGPHLIVAKAAQPVPAGTVLTLEMVTYEKVPERFVPPNPVLRENTDHFLSQPTNVDLEQGSMILTSDFDQTNPTWRSPGSAYQRR